MKFETLVIAAISVTTLSIFTSCSKKETGPLIPSYVNSSLQEKMAEGGTNPDDVLLRQTNDNAVNHFYIVSNKSGKNSVLVFKQKPNGQLVLEDEVESGGYGYGQGLGSQGAVAVSKQYNLLFAVTPPSNFFICNKPFHRRLAAFIYCNYYRSVTKQYFCEWKQNICFKQY